MSHAPSAITAFMRRCLRCGEYRAVTAGYKRVGSFLRAGTSQISDRGFICAGCAKPKEQA